MKGPRTPPRRGAGVGPSAPERPVTDTNPKDTNPKPDRLKTYRQKRDFSRTSEPEAAPAPPPGSGFVVQKHAARRLHYDLRLELDGTLLSWAVPEGPSLVSSVKRLAVRTEDHPLAYLDYEGVIPKGEYGGGTMIVWDRGDWTPVGDPHKGLAKGHLEFELHGRRLNGRWHLVRMKPRPREKTEQWLLIKANDEAARPPDADLVLDDQPASVLSGRSNADLAASGSVRADHERRRATVGKAAAALPDLRAVKGAKKSLLRPFIEPMLASPAERPPTGEKWRHEVKFDGYRMQARIDGDDVRLLTRKGLDWTGRFGGVAAALRDLSLGSAMLDGEIVVEDSVGVPRFSDLVGDLKAGRQDRFRYYVFDLMYLAGTDLSGAAYLDRKQALGAIFATRPPSDRLALSEDFAIDGPVFFEHVSRLGLEGMVSKRADSPYRSGRTGDWLKSKCILAQEFVVVGFTPSSTSRRAIGSLVLAYWRGDALVYAGRVGTGFTEDDTRALFAGLDATRADASPLAGPIPPDAAKGVRWVDPRLVAQVDYQGWTADGLIWHGVFKGLRDDRDIHEIVREDDSAPVQPAAPAVAGLTHPERLLWPADGVTKQGLADYYASAAGWILPHLVGRPLSLVRCPNGVGPDCFFAKQPWAGLSDAVRQAPVGHGALGIEVHNLAGLAALVQAAVLEIHPWGSQFGDLERPDRLIFDLDPGDDVAWPTMIEAAREVRERLKSGLGLDSFVKTTGGKGLHVVAPIVPSLGWPEATALCREVAAAMAADSPDRYVDRMAKAARKGRIFVDYLRNARGATAVAAYSTRARPGAAISTPLAWDELSEAVRSDHFRVANIERRLAHLGRDPWEGFFELRQSPAAARPGAQR